MSTWDTFIDLSRQVLQSVTYLWPVTAVLIVLAAMGLAKASARAAIEARGGWLGQIWPVAFSIAILVVGSVWACQSLECRPSSPDASPKPAEYVLLALAAAQLVIVGWQVWRLRGARVATLGLQLLLLWFSLLSTFIGAMSITNDWL